MQSIFITGGAGFIGQALVQALRRAGHRVTVYDNLHPQVHHAPGQSIARLRRCGAGFVHGDLRDGPGLTAALQASGAGVLVHLAAETGTGQSWQLPARYCEVNVTGTARLIEAARQTPGLQRVLLAGSRAVYGEGACKDATGRILTAAPRLAADLARGDFSPKSDSGQSVIPVPSAAHSTTPRPASVYASGKLMQEYLLQQGFEQSGIRPAILRLQNVFGPGQSLHNPYTGVLSVFARQLLQGECLNIYEDGHIIRDFIAVADVVSAFQRLCDLAQCPDQPLDIGSGQGISILRVARMMMAACPGRNPQLRISGDYRPGDIRHSVADISAARRELGWQPMQDLQSGLQQLLHWAGESAFA